MGPLTFKIATLDCRVGIDHPRRRAELCAAIRKKFDANPMLIAVALQGVDDQLLMLLYQIRETRTVYIDARGKAATEHGRAGDNTLAIIVQAPFCTVMTGARAILSGPVTLLELNVFGILVMNFYISPSLGMEKKKALWLDVLLPHLAGRRNVLMIGASNFVDRDVDVFRRAADTVDYFGGPGIELFFGDPMLLSIAAAQFPLVGEPLVEFLDFAVAEADEDLVEIVPISNLPLVTFEFGHRAAS